MSDTSTLLLPQHTPGQGVPDEDGQDFWHNTHGTICRASRIPGYALQLLGGRLHCNRCGFVTPEPVVTTYSPDTDKVYLTWAEYVAAETNGYVVVTISDRPKTVPAVHGPWDTVAAARKAQSRLRRSARKHEAPHNVKTYVRILHREKP